MIQRDIETEILPWLGRDKIIIVKGARQVGKTTILKSLEKRLRGENRPVRYLAADLDFADPSFGDPRLFLRRLDDLFGDRPGVVLIDEFQSIPRAGLFLKTIYDQTKERFLFVVSGSSSLDLAKNAEFLTGRKIEFTVRPFSFREFVRAKNPDIPDRILDLNDGAGAADHAKLYGSSLRALYADYLHNGGFPEIVTSPEELRLPLLKELLSTYLRRDVAGYMRVENIAGFNNLVRLLASQVGGQVNRTELGETLRLNKETISRYLDILEGTFVFKLVPPWFTNPRKETSKMPKVYALDPGYAIASGAGSIGRTPYELLDGHLVENAVWTRLAAIFGGDSVKYWRSVAGAEIDFIVESEDALLPIEVKFTSAVPKEPQAMRNFKASYPKAGAGLIVSRDQLRLDTTSEAPRVIPAWLLDYLAIEEPLVSG